MEAVDIDFIKAVFVSLISIPKLLNRVSAMRRLTDNMVGIIWEDGHTAFSLHGSVFLYFLFVAHSEKCRPHTIY